MIIVNKQGKLRYRIGHAHTGIARGIVGRSDTIYLRWWVILFNHLNSFSNPMIVPQINGFHFRNRVTPHHARIFQLLLLFAKGNAKYSFNPITQGEMHWILCGENFPFICSRYVAFHASRDGPICGERIEEILTNSLWNWAILWTKPQ